MSRSTQPIGRPSLETVAKYKRLHKREKRLVLLYALAGISIGYTSRSLPFNTAPADFLLPAALLAPIALGAGRRTSVNGTVGILIGVWLIAVGQVLPSSDTFGVESAGELIKDVLPPLIGIGIIAAVQAVPSRAQALLAGAASIGVVAAILSLSSTETRFRGPLGNPNLTAHFAACLLLAAIGCYLTVKQASKPTKAQKLVTAAALSASVPILISAASFGALLIVAGAMAYFVWSVALRLPGAMRPLVRLATFSALAGLFAKAITSPTIPGIATDSSLGDDRFQRSRGSRGELWHAGLGRITTKPLGGGPNPFSRMQSVFGARPGPGEFHADLLDMASSGGVLAVLGMILVVVGLWRLAKPGGMARGLILGCVLSSVVRQTWNFRHMWVFIGILIAVEIKRKPAQCE